MSLEGKNGLDNEGVAGMKGTYCPRADSAVSSALAALLFCLILPRYIEIRICLEWIDSF